MALDFGCGTGRSTRFLKKLGFTVTGIDISSEMISRAKSLDPTGDYQLTSGDDLKEIEDNTLDLILSVFTFDNIPSIEHKLHLLRNFGKKLKETGRLINLVSAPEIYTNEWSSFTTKCFPENRKAKDGDKVKIIMTDVKDDRPVEDILCTHECYCRISQEAGLKLVDTHRPLGKTEEPFDWKSESRVSPWCIYIFKK